MAFAGKTGAQRGSATGEPRPTARSQQQRIVCRSEAEPFDVYQGSFMNLWALQLVLGFAVFACAAEGIHLGMRWYVYPPSRHIVLSKRSNISQDEPAHAITHYFNTC